MKKMNNKGFSLVELIIVIAIMAILIAVLAPQFLRYVEKSRLQADNSAVGEVANAAKVAVASDKINQEVASGVTLTLSTSAGPVGGAGTLLSQELNNVVGTSIRLKSNAYASTTPSIQITINSAGVASVQAQNFIPEVGDVATTVDF